MPFPITFGRILKTVKVEDLVLIETTHPAGMRLPRHDHGNASLNLTLSGSYQEIFRSRSVSSDSSTVVLKPAGEFHANRYGAGDTRCVMVEFGPRAAGQVRALSGVLDKLWTVRGGPAAAAMLELSRELHLGDRASSLIIEGCIWRVLGHMERQSHPTRLFGRPSWLSRVEEFMRENSHRRPSLTEISAVADVHPAHLSKIFRRHFRVSVGSYLRRLQVERTRALLTDSRFPLARIAADTGFCDQSHFTRVFRAVVGTTPSEYRREIRASGPRRR